MSKIEINDLIGDAVENAIARRKEALTAEEAKQVKGGAIAKSIAKLPNPTTAGGRIVTFGMWFPQNNFKSL